jgi:uncharacterized protein YkwD
MKRAVVMLGLALVLTGAIAGPTRAADATPATMERLQALDAAVLIQLNATRVAHGLRPLVVSGQLETAAVAHSREMLEGGFFAHDTPGGSSFVQRLKHYYTPTGYSSWSAGENLIYSSAALDANQAIRVWLDSPSHRENMLDPTWHEVGIGSLYAPSAGGTFGGDPTWVITMDFGTRTGTVAAAKRVTVVKTRAERRAVTTATTAIGRKLVKAMTATRIEKALEQHGGSKGEYTPPVRSTKAKHGHKANTAHAPKVKTKTKIETGGGKGKPKKTRPKKTPTRILPTPVPTAPSIPVPTSPDTARHHDGDDVGDDGVEEGTAGDPGLPPEALPPPAG